MRKIWLAGGCFWGAEAYFQQLKGVVDTTVGYGQGDVADPSYEQVCSGRTGHAEVVEIQYDETVLSLPDLLEHYFRIIDPTTLDRQGPDRGTQYRTGIYYKDEAERKQIVEFVCGMQAKYSEPIVVEIESMVNFYPAESYHQDYLQKNPGGYCHIDLGLARREERK